MANGAVEGLVRAAAIEMAPQRINDADALTAPQRRA
jgi:hypothetical protein